MDIHSNIRNEIFNVKDEAKWILSGGAIKTKHSSTTTKTSSPLDRKNTTATAVNSSVTTTPPPPHWIYKIHVNGGGSIIYAPKLRFAFPKLLLEGQKSPTT
eukprot:7436481-Ditylum_brightwellii.AAC.1